jgi:3-phenylpropionate/trans-cinnamate dioxygenase ferredoxin component
MSTFIKAGNTTDYSDGTKKKVTVSGQEILLVKAENNYYAIANRCPHLNGDLSMGTLEGTVITCPRHASQFDIRDGKVIRWTNWTGAVKAMAGVFKSERPVKTYKTKVENGEISVEV